MQKKPNIILVNCDDLGYGDLGCYGSQVNHTPVLDRMADEGMRFTDFYMPAPLCSPSRAGMMTGCYPARVGFDTYGGSANHFGFSRHQAVLFPGDPVGLHPEEITFADILKNAGYRTKLVGKWHCGDQPGLLPTDHGFDEYFGIPFSNDMGRSSTRTHFPPLPLMRDGAVHQEQPDQSALTERYASESLDFIRANKDRPFLLYLAHMYVHVPIFVPKPFLKKSKNGKYGAAVECVDWCMGVILHELKKLGIDDNTLVIFTSDNGGITPEGGSNAPLRGSKGSTWEGGIRVPCIARWPGTIPAGKTSSAVCTAMDFLPTFAACADASAPQGRRIDGQDISPILRGEQAEKENDTFAYYAGPKLMAIRSGRWKLQVVDSQRRDGTWHDSACCILYDLKNDIGETVDVASAHPDIVNKLQDHLSTIRQDLGDSFTNTPGKGKRPIGRIDNPQVLTTYDPEHPYIIAEYDISDPG